MFSVSSCVRWSPEILLAKFDVFWTIARDSIPTWISTGKLYYLRKTYRMAKSLHSCDPRIEARGVTCSEMVYIEVGLIPRKYDLSAHRGICAMYEVSWGLVRRYNAFRASCWTRNAWSIIRSCKAVLCVLSRTRQPRAAVAALYRTQLFKLAASAVLNCLKLVYSLLELLSFQMIKLYIKPN